MRLGFYNIYILNLCISEKTINKTSKKMWSLLLPMVLAIGCVLATESEIVMEHEDAVASGQTQQSHQQVPSPEDLLRMLDSMEGLSDKEKNELREQLLNQVNQGDLPPVDDVDDPQMTKPISGGMFDGSFLVLVGLIGLILTVIGKDPTSIKHFFFSFNFENDSQKYRNRHYTFQYF